MPDRESRCHLPAVVAPQSPNLAEAMAKMASYRELRAVGIPSSRAPRAGQSSSRQPERMGWRTTNHTQGMLPAKSRMRLQSWMNSWYLCDGGHLRHNGVH